jgi:hypothetical protein
MNGELKKKKADEFLDEPLSADAFLDEKPKADEFLGQTQYPKTSVPMEVLKGTPGVLLDTLKQAGRTAGAESLRTVAPFVDLAKQSLPYFDEEDATKAQEFLGKVAQKIDPTGASSRENLINLFSSNENEILKTAQETGKVPYGKILARTMADSFTKMIPTNPAEAAVFYGGGKKVLQGAVEALQEAFPFLGKGISDLIFRKNVIVPQEALPEVMKATNESFLDTFTKGASTQEATKSALETFEQEAARLRGEAISRSPVASIPPVGPTTLPSIQAPGGIPATELSIPGKIQRNASILIDKLKRLVGGKPEPTIETEGTVLPEGETPPTAQVPGKPVEPSAPSIPGTAIKPAETVLPPSGFKFNDKTMPVFSQLVNSILPTSEPESLRKAILEIDAQATESKINGMGMEQAEAVAIAQLKDKIQRGEIPSQIVSQAREPESKYGPTLKETASELIQAGKEIKNIVSPSKSAPLAATITREQLGKMARSYDKAEYALRGAWKYLEDQTTDAKIDFIDKMEHGQEQPTPELQTMAKSLRDLLDSKRDEIRSLGTGKLEAFIENYFPHVWEQGEVGIENAVRMAAKRPFEGSKAFLKKRTITFFKDGIDLGLIPVSYNPVDLTLLKIREMDKYLMAHRTLNAYKENGLAQFVKIGKEIPDGWVKIDDRISTVMFPSPQGMVISGHYYAQPDAARIINNYLSPGLQKSSIYRAFRYMGNAINQFQLGFSAFHLGFTSLDAMVSKMSLGLNQLGLGHPIESIKAYLQAPFAPIQNIIRGNKLLKAWRGQGKSGIDEILATAMESGGGRSRMDQFYSTRAYNQMKKYFQGGKYLRGILRIPLMIAEASSKPILEYIVPRQKLGVFADIMKMELEHNPDMTHEQMRSISRKAWDSVDNRMGQLVYDNLFWNRIFKDLLLASVRSVGWNLGTIREIGGGVIDIKQIGRGEKGRGINLSYRTSYVINLIFGVGILGAIYQYLKTGKGPEELKDYFFPKSGGVDANGDPNRKSLPSYVKDIYHYSSAPVKTILNKTNPSLAIISQMFSNKDFYGVKILNEDDPLMKQIISEANYLLKQMIPFGIRNVQRGAQQGKTSLSDIVESFVGIIPAPYDINQTPAKKRAHRILASKIPIGGRTQAAADRSQLIRDLRNRIKVGDPAANRDMMDAFKQGKISAQEIKDVMRTSRLTPLQRLVHGMTAEEAQKVYDVSNDDEKNQIETMVKGKIARHRKGWVTQP